MSNTIPFAVIGLSAIGAGVVFTRGRLRKKGMPRMPTGGRADETFFIPRMKAAYSCDTNWYKRLGPIWDKKLGRWEVQDRWHRDWPESWNSRVRFWLKNGMDASIVCETNRDTGNALLMSVTRPDSAIPVYSERGNINLSFESMVNTIMEAAKYKEPAPDFDSETWGVTKTDPGFNPLAGT